MKRIVISIVLGISMFSLVSCGNKVANQEDIKNKYPIESYLEKGATLEEYLSNGTAVMKDTKGQDFFVGDKSTYKVVLSDDGVILPYIVIDDIAYYFDSEISEKKAPKGLKKSGKISTFGGNPDGLSNDSNASFTFIQSLVIYIDESDNNLVYAQYNGDEGYQVWKNYDAIQSK